jgi:hypothetical protein
METQARYRIPLRIVVVTMTVAAIFGIGVMMSDVWMPPPIDGRESAIQSGLRTHAASAPVASNAPAGTVCPRCGVVESVHRAGNAGNIARAAVAARASGGDLMTLLVVGLSALTGNRFEDESTATAVYEITVRFEDGSSRVLTSVGSRAWQPGDRVKVIRGRLQPNV